MKVTRKEYEAQIQQLSLGFQKWLKEHPGSTPKIQFNYPRNTWPIMPMGEALKHSFMSADGQGLEMLRAVCPTGILEPTPMMVKIALDCLELD